jgi:hypothetical protein
MTGRMFHWHAGALIVILTDIAVSTLAGPVSNVIGINGPSLLERYRGSILNLSVKKAGPNTSVNINLGCIAHGFSRASRPV